jgi:pyruvate/2-oxoglutarate dehydrogenase complex dihydrolipoamide dehydrogenase (E3) component
VASGLLRLCSLARRRELTAERLLVATGRTPVTPRVWGSSSFGVEITPGIVVDDGLRAAESVWAIGDVTGGAVHARGQVPGTNRGEERRGARASADYRAIPAVVSPTR